ncbi:MAG TPA: hypothetical protein VGT41_01935 [Candidatus Babeliales bacterium]|nr:hypothetical protein [Candidatus Babeliales bacterium]
MNIRMSVALIISLFIITPSLHAAMFAEFFNNWRDEKSYEAFIASLGNASDEERAHFEKNGFKNIISYVAVELAKPEVNLSNQRAKKRKLVLGLIQRTFSGAQVPTRTDAQVAASYLAHGAPDQDPLAHVSSLFAKALEATPQEDGANQQELVVISEFLKLLQVPQGNTHDHDVGDEGASKLQSRLSQIQAKLNRSDELAATEFLAHGSPELDRVACINRLLTNALKPAKDQNGIPGEQEEKESAETQQALTTLADHLKLLQVPAEGTLAHDYFHHLVLPALALLQHDHDNFTIRSYNNGRPGVVFSNLLYAHEEVIIDAKEKLGLPARRSFAEAVFSFASPSHEGGPDIFGNPLLGVAGLLTAAAARARNYKKTAAAMGVVSLVQLAFGPARNVYNELHTHRFNTTGVAESRKKAETLFNLLVAQQKQTRLLQSASTPQSASQGE